MQERKAKFLYLMFAVNDRISLETIAFNYLPKNDLSQIARLE